MLSICFAYIFSALLLFCFWLHFVFFVCFFMFSSFLCFVFFACFCFCCLCFFHFLFFPQTVSCWGSQCVLNSLSSILSSTWDAVSGLVSQFVSGLVSELVSICLLACVRLFNLVLPRSRLSLIWSGFDSSNCLVYGGVILFVLFWCFSLKSQNQIVLVSRISPVLVVIRQTRKGYERVAYW